MFKLEEMIYSKGRSGDLTVGAYTGKEIQDAIQEVQDFLLNGGVFDDSSRLTPFLVTELKTLCLFDKRKYRIFIGDKGCGALAVYVPCVNKLTGMINMGCSSKMKHYSGAEIKKLVQEILDAETSNWYHNQLERVDLEKFRSTYMTGRHAIADNKQYWLSYNNSEGGTISCRKWEGERTKCLN